MKFTPEMERVRASVFSDLSPQEFVVLLEHKRAQFAAAPAETQQRMREALDTWEAETTISRVRYARRLARIAAQNAIEQAAWQARRSSATRPHIAGLLCPKD